MIKLWTDIVSNRVASLLISNFFAEIIYLQMDRFTGKHTLFIEHIKNYKTTLNDTLRLFKI